MKNAHFARGIALATVVLFASGAPVDAGPGAGRSGAATAPVSSLVPKHALKAYVLRCVDGDTIVIRLNGREEKVRLKGVDTPETVAPHTPVQPWGKAASHFTKDQLEHRSVWIESATGAKHDMFGRLLAYVWLADGTCHNETLVSKGLARVQRHYKFDRVKEYDALEKAAKAAKLGIWS